MKFLLSNSQKQLKSRNDVDKVVGVIIRLRKSDNVENSKNILISMLEELIRKEDAAIKKKNLTEKYGFIMNEETERRVNSMCNLSEVIAERAYNDGISQGISQGISMVVEKMMKAGKPLDEIEALTGITIDELKKMAETVAE